MGTPESYSAHYASYYAVEPGEIYVFTGAGLESSVTIASQAAISISALTVCEAPTRSGSAYQA